MCSAEVMDYIEKQAGNMKHNGGNVTSPNGPCSQLKRVELPKFEGDKAQYFNWKAAFSACVDAAVVAPEIKLLHLRQYLGGSALKAIEGLGHSGQAYVLALEILEQKFGGTRRQTTIYLEQVENFPVLRSEKGNELERFSDLLNLLVLNLQESKRTEELGQGVLYIQLQKKLPKSLLSDYHRWIYEKNKIESVLALQKFISLETKFRTTASETIQGITNVNISSENSPVSYQAQIRCKLCSRSHDLTTCTEFLDMDETQRWNTARKYRLCYRCLKSNHLKRNCNSTLKCDVKNCSQSHHKLLHTESEVLGYHTSEVRKKVQTVISMRTVPIVVHFNGKELNMNALLDDGSSQTFVNIDVIKALGIRECNKRNISVSVLNGKNSSLYTSDVEFQISGQDKRKMFKISAMTTKSVVGDLHAINWENERENFAHLKDIPFIKLNNKTKVDMLIGVDHPYLHQAICEVKGDIGEPIARLTPLGWTCVGKTQVMQKTRVASHFVNKISMFATDQHDLQEINKTLKKFWEFDEINPTQECYSLCDNEILEETRKSFKKSADEERYEIGVPWKDNRHLLKNNYPLAFKRLQNTEAQLIRKNDVNKLYQDTIDKYIQKNYIREIAENEIDETCWYLPHFPVIRMEKETSKVRIVFDASAQYKGLSLNETINQGPNLQQDLLKVLIRFRRKQIALVCDITEMYLQVQIPENDRKFFRFLWRNIDQSKEPSVFEFQRVIFGGNASPYQAQFVSRENATMHQNEFPRAAETVLFSTYMDDSLDSVDTPEQAIQLYKDLSSLWGKAGMRPQKWLSNNANVLKEIPEKERAKHIELAENFQLPTTKTLGLVWNAQNDSFSFKIEKPLMDNYTKRSFLRLTASIFDPLGLLCPFIVRAKIIMQLIWVKKFDWDETLDSETQNLIHKWVEELSIINGISFPRCIAPSNDQTKKSTLHIFVDASENAVAAVAYLRTIGKNDAIDVRLVCAKTKVAPLHAVSMPRLELIGAEIGTTLGEKVIPALAFNKSEVYYWTDSRDVLGWIYNRSKLFKPFVAHKVSQIQQISDTSKWMKVPSNLNPADVATRGLKAFEFEKIPQWLNGPEFLRKDEECWPLQEKYDTLELKEMKSKAYCVMPCIKINNWRLEPSRFSDWTRLCRITAWTIRFIENCKEKINKRKGILEFDEIENAQNIFIRRAQEESFGKEIAEIRKIGMVTKTSKIQVLCPKLDENNILRANSRINGAEFLNYNTKYPIILPRGHIITLLIVKKYHEEGNHNRGTNGTLSDLSARYWIIAAREEIRSWENRCNECKKRKCKPAQQIMAPLPISRLGGTMKAFDKCGLDFAGPFETKAGRGKARHKRYLCLFTCMAVRAVHLEMAYSLDTNSFLNAFWRFVHRRGVPTEITSDNGTNFIKGEKELRSLVKSLNKNQIREKTTHKNIKWIFNPPYSPHHGGVFETMIKSSKKAMYGVIRNSDITDEEFLTTITGSEDLINSRPITYQCANPEDIIPLTPNHFLHGQMGGNFAPEGDQGKMSLIQRWKRVQEILRHFWQRWMREWLPSIGKRNKWSTIEQNVNEGDIVLVLWPGTERGKWPLGKIVQSCPGSDGNVRVVNVLVNGKIYRRGLNTIYPLQI